MHKLGWNFYVKNTFLFDSRTHYYWKNCKDNIYNVHLAIA